MTEPAIITILRDAFRMGASDVHMVSGTPVMMRIQGELTNVPGVPMFDPETCISMLSHLLTEPQKEYLEKTWTVNTTFGLDNVRYRMNVSYQRQGLEAVFRIIPSRIPTPEELSLPSVITNLSELERGLVLVTGPTGSGKSTTLACLLERINQTRQDKIITIEDPIEFVYTSKKSFVSQKEIGQHTPNYEQALHEVLRQDPDVILIGELRDYETMAAAIQIADTGHLVLATLHSVDAPQAVERIVDVFPGHQQQQIRAQLASILRGVIAQMLLPRLDGTGRVGAFEILINTSAVAAMIRTNRTHEIYSAMEMGTAEGMKTIGRSLSELVKQGVIDPAYLPTTPLTTPHRSSATSRSHAKSE